MTRDVEVCHLDKMVTDYDDPARFTEELAKNVEKLKDRDNILMSFANQDVVEQNLKEGMATSATSRVLDDTAKVVDQL